MHQVSQHPKCSPAEVVKQIGRYDKTTKDIGLILKPDYTKNVDCWVDADFSGNWHVETALSDPTTSKSHTGCLITYTGYINSWGSKLQTQATLFTTEAEYIALSTALQEQIPLMNLLQEVMKKGIDTKYQ